MPSPAAADSTYLKIPRPWGGPRGSGSSAVRQSERVRAGWLARNGLAGIAWARLVYWVGPCVQPASILILSQVSCATCLPVGCLLRRNGFVGAEQPVGATVRKAVAVTEIGDRTCRTWKRGRGRAGEVTACLDILWGLEGNRLLLLLLPSLCCMLLSAALCARVPSNMRTRGTFRQRVHLEHVQLLPYTSAGSSRLFFESVNSATDSTTAVCGRESSHVEGEYHCTMDIGHGSWKCNRL